MERRGQEKRQRTAEPLPRRTQVFGLVCSGGASQLWLSRLPEFRDRLGPVKGPGIRSASRLVNTLRAGWSVESWPEFNVCSGVVLAVPRRQAAAHLEALVRAPIDWTGKLLMVIDTELDVVHLRHFEEQGARTVTVDRVMAGSLPCVVLQGDAASLRTVRSLFPMGQFRLVEVEPGRRDAFLAGVTLASSLCLPLLAASAEAFAATGVPPTQAQLLAEDMLARTARSFLRGGKKAWTGAVAEGDIDAIERRWDGLRVNHPGQAALFLDLAATVARHFGRDEEMARTLEKIPSRHFGARQLRVTGD